MNHIVLCQQGSKMVQLGILLHLLHNRQGMMELIERGLDHTEGGKAD